MKTNHRKAFLCVVALILLCLSLCPVALGAVPDHTSQFYVNDYADVLSDETESYILNTAVQLKNETTAQVCVLTIDSLDGEDISEYSVDVFRKWGIGDEENDNGVLIVLSVDDRELWITTGYGIEGTLTDAKLGALRDTYAIPYYSENDFDTGTKRLFEAIVSVIRTEEYGLEALEGYGYVSSVYNEEMELTASDLISVLFFLASPFLLVGVITFCQFIKFLRLRRSDRLNGTNNAAIYRQNYKEKRKQIIILLLHMFLRGGRFRPRHIHGGYDGRSGGFGGFGGGGGFRGGGGSTGGGGAGGKF